MTLNPALHQARAWVLAEALRGGNLTFYTAPQPNAGAEITTQIALAIFTLPLEVSPVESVITLSLSHADILTNGVAVWARIANSQAQWVLDGDCGAVGSTALLQMTSLALISGGRLVPLTVHFAAG